MKTVDIAGQKFGLLTAVEKNGTKSGYTAWRCSCECGNEVTVAGKALRNGNTKSCGCMAKSALIERNKASAKHGMSNSAAFTVWTNMKERCLNPNHKSFNRYGGRGIKICDRWLESFENFLTDMGHPLPGLSIDRIEVSGNYEPGNCRWATAEEQSNNRENNRTVEYDGRTQTIAQWAREIGMSRQALRHRLESCWSIEEAMTMKLNHGNNWIRMKDAA